MAREDLNPIEEARACALLVEELGLTREDVGRRVGRSRVAVSNLMRLLDLPDEVIDLLAARPPDRGSRPRAADWRTTTTTAAAWPAGRREGWTVRQTEARARDAGRATHAAPAARAASPSRPGGCRRAARRCARRALGADVRSRPRGDGYRVELDFADSTSAEALAGVSARPPPDGLTGRYNSPPRAISSVG